MLPEVSSGDDAQAQRKLLTVMQTLRSLNIIRDAESWHDLPTFAMGASSGGAFVLLLPFHMQLQVRPTRGMCTASLRAPLVLDGAVRPMVAQGICAQIMGVPSQLWAEQLPSLSWRYPPTAFVHMSRDTRTAAVVADDLKALGKAHVPTREISIEPSPMTAATLSDVIEEVRWRYMKSYAKVGTAPGSIREHPCLAGGCRYITADISVVHRSRHVRKRWTASSRSSVCTITSWPVCMSQSMIRTG